MAIIRVKLKQWTPLLHFQADQSGACLRATEVKPKLDRFVAQFLDHQQIKAPEAWKLDAPEGRHHTPLKYKLRLSGSGTSSASIHPLYFANSAGVKAMTYADGITLTILPMTTARLGQDVALHDQKPLVDPTLGELLSALLPPFFALHCFGARSGKGFGSFDVDGAAPLSDEALHFYAPKDCAAVYRLETLWNNYDSRACLDDIFILSAMMKGGFNTPYYKGEIQKALWSKNIGSDKAFIKQMIFPNAKRPNGEPLSDWYKRSARHSSSETNYSSFRYLRAMLGLADHYSYRNPHERNFETINVSVVPPAGQGYREKIQRFANPVRFKPCEDGFRIIVFQIPQVLRKSTFVFKYKGQNIEPDGIKMPSEKELDIAAFVDDFLNPLKTKSKERWESIIEKEFKYRDGTRTAFEDVLTGLTIASAWTRTSERKA